MGVGGATLVGVDGGVMSFDSDSRGKRRFFGGAIVSLIGGDSTTNKSKNELYFHTFFYQDARKDYHIGLR